MKGPLFRKENGEFKLIDCCSDCAFATYGEKEADTTCFMDPCPCLPPDEEDDDG